MTSTVLKAENPTNVRPAPAAHAELVPLGGSVLQLRLGQTDWPQKVRKLRAALDLDERDVVVLVAAIGVVVGVDLDAQRCGVHLLLGTVTQVLLDDAVRIVVHVVLPQADVLAGKKGGRKYSDLLVQTRKDK